MNNSDFQRDSQAVGCGGRRSRGGAGNRRRAAELGHVPILQNLLIETIRSSPENAELYRPIDRSDPEVKALALSIAQFGVREPLIVTADKFIVSGHRRHAAARLAGLSSVPCRIERFRRSDDPDRFVRLLREHNRQRIKTRDEVVREEIVSVDPAEAYQALIDHRRETSRIATPAMQIAGTKRRAMISAAKTNFLAAVQQIIKERQPYWPLSDRQVHYALLNDPPLIHASKPDSRYANTLQSYKALTDLLTRARLEGSVPWQAIGDETRPFSSWSVWRRYQHFISEQLGGFLKGYYRDLMQSQPNHIEIVGEKMTLASVIRPIASDYCVPMTLGRGYCSLPPRRDMVERWRRSGKAGLVVLFLTDHDPDGEEIAQSFARSMRDDFGVSELHPIKVALTAEQVVEHKLPPRLKAKSTSSNYAKFVKQHGRNAWELEALRPEALQQILHDVIDAVIDRAAFNAEIDSERKDAVHLEGVRRRVHRALEEVGEDIV